ncbi:MAG: site-2 protease family protein [Nitrospirales bacterium]
MIPYMHEEESDTAKDDLSANTPPPGLLFPIVLFIVTVFTTLWAGAYQTRSSQSQGAWQFLVNDPSVLWKGVPFAGTLLAILLTHEFGHYIYSRIHRVPASLPIFIPGPAHFIGTFGAIIRLRGPILDRKALFDIGVAGPISGFVVAVVALGVGLSLSEVVPRPLVLHPADHLQLGEPVLYQLVAWLVIGPIPLGTELVLHPVAYAAWFGLFITFLNLIPIGQLDGGHVAYALWGAHQRTIAMATIPVLLVLGLVGWYGWSLWALLGSFLGVTHPPVSDPQAVLGRSRVRVGWFALAIFILTFTPVPFSFN